MSWGGGMVVKGNEILQLINVQKIIEAAQIGVNINSKVKVTQPKHKSR